MGRFKPPAVRLLLGQASMAAGVAQTHGCPLLGITPSSWVRVPERSPSHTPPPLHTHPHTHLDRALRSFQHWWQTAALTSGPLPAKGTSASSVSKTVHKGELLQTLA